MGDYLAGLVALWREQKPVVKHPSLREEDAL